VDDEVLELAGEVRGLDRAHLVEVVLEGAGVDRLDLRDQRVLLGRERIVEVDVADADVPLAGGDVGLQEQVGAAEAGAQIVVGDGRDPILGQVQQRIGAAAQVELDPARGVVDREAVGRDPTARTDAEHGVAGDQLGDGEGQHPLLAAELGVDTAGGGAAEEAEGSEAREVGTERHGFLLGASHGQAHQEPSARDSTNPRAARRRKSRRVSSPAEMCRDL